MGLNSKLKAGIEEEEDRISKLPDNILHRILSFLPTKYAVTTSVLSSSWRNLWKAIDVIDIDYHHMLNPSSVGEDTVKLKLFIFFIYGVLKNCDSTVIHKFRLSCPKYIGLSCIRVFVDVACSRNVQELDMDIQFGSVSELSHKLFTCKSLEVLKLRTDYVIHVPPLVGCFPNLKVLHVRFNNAVADFCERFFDGCPKLVDLMIDARPREAIDMCFKISATSLKKLVILLPVDLDYKFSYKFEVDAPELEHLRLQDDSTACSLVGSFSKLKSATLDLGIIDIRHASFEHEFFIVERLNEVVSTRYLSLSLDTTNGLRRLITLPTFYNLTCLRIILHDYIARKTLYSLLKASPKLQILILEMVNMVEKGELSRPLNWPSYAHDCFEKPVCLLQELKVVTMCSFRGQFVERNVIKYFLESAKTLCKMTIYAVDSSVKQKFSKRLLKLPRSSKHCKVEIH